MRKVLRTLQTLGPCDFTTAHCLHWCPVSSIIVNSSVEKRDRIHHVMLLIQLICY